MFPDSAPLPARLSIRVLRMTSAGDGGADPDPMETFSAQLRRLQAASGAPSVRKLVELTRVVGEPLPRSTIQDVLQGRARPARWETVKAIVQACALPDDPDLTPWREGYDQLVRDLASRRKGMRAGAEAAGQAARDQARADRERWSRDEYRIVDHTPGPAPLRLPMRDRRARPSYLLTARNRVVPFTGRAAELVELARWRDDDEHPRLSVMLVHGPGGQGKTRLIDEFADRTLINRGWAVQAVIRGHRGRATPAVAEPGPSDGVLLVVDYAERWPMAELVDFIGAQQASGQVRVLLAARPAGPWWRELSRQLADDLDLLAVEAMRVEPLADDPAEREAVFEAARDRFAEVLAVPGAGRLEAPRGLDGPEFGLILTVHMAALVAVDAFARGVTPPADPTGLAIYLLDRERKHWRRLHDLPARRDNERDEAHLATPPRVMARAVYLSILTRPVDRSLGLGLVTRADLAGDTAGAAVPSADHQPLTVGEILDDHARCYPPADDGAETVLEPLYPDRLAEDYLALQTHGQRDRYPADGWASGNLLARLLTGDTSAGVASWAGSAVTVLIESAHRWPDLRLKTLYPVLPGIPGWRWRPAAPR